MQMKPIKELGQNFLTDLTVAQKMVDLLNLQKGDFVLEIGPGLGVLTSFLVKTDVQVWAVEIDKRLVVHLKTVYKNAPNLEIIEGDILDWLQAFNPDKPVKVIGSLPYYITSPIIHHLIKMKITPEIVVLLVQKEVAKKICTIAPDSSYLSIIVQTFFDVDYINQVKNDKFTPKPLVDSAIIKLTKGKNSQIVHEDIRKYEGFLHKGFSNPRKMLNKVFTKNELSLININPSLRPQNLNVTDWINMFTKLVKSKGGGDFHV